MITLEEIMFNSLMPWSTRNSDDFLFTELNVWLSQISGYRPGIYFTRLRQVFHELALEPIAELEAEWKLFAASEGSIPEGLFSKIAQYRHPQQKVLFYAKLLSRCGIAELNLLKQDSVKHPDSNYMRHKLRNLCRRLERMISIPNADSDYAEEDLTIIKLTKLTSIIIYLEIITQYSREIHTERLKLTSDALYDQLVMISMESKPSGIIVRDVKCKYLPYFRTGPAAYKNGQGLEQPNRNRHQKGAGESVAGAASKNDQEKQKDNKTDKSEDRIIGSGEVMRILGISKATLKRWRDDEKIEIPFSRPNPKGRCSYKFSEIIEFAKTMKKNAVENI